MPWQTQALLELTKEAKDLIKKNYNLEINTPVYIVTEEEIVTDVLKEQNNIGRSKKELEKIKIELKYILGKYFALKNEIWLLEREGIIIDVIIHEMLHSVQKCIPHREHIVDYLTFKIIGNEAFILESTISDWGEIEKSYGMKKILERFQREGSCEELN